MPIKHYVRSSIKFIVGFSLLLGVAFYGDSNMVSYLFDNTSPYPEIHAANADHTSLRLLRGVVPGADRFADKEGEPPVYKAYRTELDGSETLIGYAVVTPDVPPEPNGYNGPIDTLIGIDLEGNITGLKVIYYKESLRYTIGDFFSWGFEDQFVGKRANERFQVGDDIDGISKATISAKAAARGIRQALSAVTREYIQ